MNNAYAGCRIQFPTYATYTSVIPPLFSHFYVFFCGGGGGVSKQHPFTVDFNLENIKKSAGAKSGE